jgi:hypothetical protein
MLSLFLSAGNRVSKGPAHQSATEGDSRKRPNVEPEAVQNEDAIDSEIEGGTCEAGRMISYIIANAEFLQVMYGRTQSLSNIIDTANDLKKKLMENPAPEDERKLN